VRAALANPRRKILRAILSERAASELGPRLLAQIRYEIVPPDTFDRLLPKGSVHQGAALNCEPLARRSLEDVLIGSSSRRVVLVLDQIADPHNTGAILRSAAAFSAAAVVVQDRHSAPESGALAKAASGALDLVPYIEVVNVARALDELGELGFFRIGLAGDGDGALRDCVGNGDIALVLGSEGSGIRRLVRERCDQIAYIPISSQMESLNVSNAAAIALYEARR
jgi:23S rRNA (guanosine2251-2'-O)-methyltransferase